MSYFLRITKREKGNYLQICETIYNPLTKKSSNKNYKILGYEEDLKTEEIKNPIDYFKNEVEKLNLKVKEEKMQKVSETEPITKNIGYFLPNAILNTLNVEKDLNLMGNGTKYEHSIYDFIRYMMFCQIYKPSSKSKNASDILPQILNSPTISEDQIYRMINFIGANYKKYIEIFNKHYDETYKRNYKNFYFDCTNFYFEIDLPFEDKQKGPSKENRKEPIIGQALLLDANQIPLAMEMYPGNHSEKPYIRKLVEEIKNKSNIEGRTIQVADKGLNCARNIYFAVKEANDGYVFSKSVHGKNLSDIEKKRVLLDNETNVWHEVYDNNGKLKYKFKEIIDTFKYKFINDDNEIVEFEVKEKRVVSFNSELAKKQILEINKQIEKIKKLKTIKSISKSEYGDAIKYVIFNDKNGEIVEMEPSLNTQKINEDKTYAGYNLLVSSETKLSGKEIYDIYHGLWRIEESFRILKSYLDARPIYLQTKESIYGHFLICYLSLFVLRILEIKEFEDKLSANEIINYIRHFTVCCYKDRYISNILYTKTLQEIQQKTCIAFLDNAYLYDKDINNLLKYEF